MNKNEMIGSLQEEVRRLRVIENKLEREAAAALQARQVLGQVKDTVEQANIGGWTQAHINGLVDITRRALWILEGK